MLQNIVYRCFEVFTLCLLFTCSQRQQYNRTVINTNNSSIVCFYNVENLFDTIDDPTKNDNEFLPTGKKEWDYYKYLTKSNRIAQVLRSVGERNFPHIIGLAEVENNIVLQDLLLRPAFRNKNYKIVHQDSPDPRGIDVALLFSNDHYNLLDYGFITVNSREYHVRSRDILYASLISSTDTVHVYVNHWSSRLGGQLKSESKRTYASKLLISHIDSISEVFKSPHVIVMGDFNDDPWSKSLKMLSDEGGLVNLSSGLENCGTTYYKKNWYCFDQFLVSKNLVDSTSNLNVSNISVANFNFLSKQTSSGVSVPNRTYKGSFYNNGFSDHYPVYLKLNYNK